jgi:hypothetical protein
MKHQYTYKPAMESPVETIRKQLPQGDATWAGFASVYKRIASACEVMARTKYVYLSDEHTRAMAILGCGHEETMKAELSRLRMRI